MSAIASDEPQACAMLSPYVGIDVSSANIALKCDKHIQEATHCERDYHTSKKITQSPAERHSVAGMDAMYSLYARNIVIER
jgi:hypothetical protein